MHCPSVSSSNSPPTALDSIRMTNNTTVSLSKYWSRSASLHSDRSTLLLRLRLVFGAIHSVPLLLPSDIIQTDLGLSFGLSLTIHTMSFSFISHQYIWRIVTFPLHSSYIPRCSSDETPSVSPSERQEGWLRCPFTAFHRRPLRRRRLSLLLFHTAPVVG